MLATAGAGTNFIAAGALWLSFTSLADLARRARISVGQTPAWPLIVNGIIIVATISVVALSPHGRRATWYPWLPHPKTTNRQITNPLGDVQSTTERETNEDTMQTDPRNHLITPRSAGRLPQNREPTETMDRSAEFDHLKLHDPSIRRPMPIQPEPALQNRAVFVRASDLLAQISRASGTGISWIVAAHRWARRQVRHRLATTGRATAHTAKTMTTRATRSAVNR